MALKLGLKIGLSPLGFMKSPAVFAIDFSAGNALPAAGAFARSAIAMVRDHEDIYRHLKSGEMPRRGLRRVENLFTASDTPATRAITVVVGARYAFYFRGGGTGSYALTGAATATVDEGEAFTFTATTTTLTCTYTAGASPGAGATVQLEENSGASVNAPSKYVSIATTYNAQVAGVRYFTTTNGNTFSAPGPGSVTEADGSTIAAATRQGALVEPAETNKVTQSYDLTGWTAGGSASTALDEVGIDGRDDTATTVTDDQSGSASSINQTMSLAASTVCTAQVWVKKADSSLSAFPMIRVISSTRDGRLHIDHFNGTTFIETPIGGSDISVKQVDDVGDWWRFVFNYTTLGATDAIYVYPAWTTTLTGSGTAAATGSVIIGQVQVAEADCGTSPIRTTGSTATRAVSTLTMPLGIAAPWTLFMDCQPQTVADIAAHKLLGYASGSNEAKVVRGTTRYTGSLNDGTDNPSADVTDASSGYVMGDQLKVALSSVDGDQVRVAVNGQAVEDTTGGVVDTSTFATIGIGMLQTGGPSIPITIRQAQLLNVAKTTAELAAMTTI